MCSVIWSVSFARLRGTACHIIKAFNNKRVGRSVPSREVRAFPVEFRRFLQRRCDRCSRGMAQGVGAVGVRRSIGRGF